MVVLGLADCDAELETPPWAEHHAANLLLLASIEAPASTDSITFTFAGAKPLHRWDSPGCWAMNCSQLTPFKRGLVAQPASNINASGSGSISGTQAGTFMPVLISPHLRSPN